MDFVKDALSGGSNDNDNNNNNNNNQGGQSGEQKESGSGGGGFLGGLGDKINSAAGGGKESEKNEDMLDKGVDAVQEYGLGQGKQDNESAVEQAKDEQISDFVRSKFSSTTGKDFPVEDKPTKFG